MTNWITKKFRSVFKRINNDKTAEPPIQKKVSIPSEAKTEPKIRSVKAKKKSKRWNISQFDVPPVEGKTRFHDLNLSYKIMHAIADLKFQYCTPIQAETLPRALTGKDATGQAQTGTGKSAAFLITIYNRFLQKPIKGKRKPGTPRALIIAPTRELALQIEKDAQGIGKYTRSRALSVFGGMAYEKQKKALQNKIIDIVVATPGRLLDFKRQKIVDLSKVEILVIDEADRMLDMGFIADIRQIVYSTPKKDMRQTLFFSATITPEVKRLAESWTKNSFNVEIEPETIAAENIKQIVYIVTNEEKFHLLYNLIEKLDCVLVFSNRRDQTRDLKERLRKHGISCALLSGEVPQTKRLTVLENFRNGKTKVLVATDVAARGIHVEGISHVINYNLPHDAEDYVHRIGRTGRAERKGTSISFACEDDSFYIPAIEEMLGEKLECEQPDPGLLKPPPKPVKQRPQQKTKSRRPASGKKHKNHYPANKRKSSNYNSRKNPNRRRPEKK